METEKQRIEELVKQLNAASAAYYNGQDEIGLMVNGFNEFIDVLKDMIDKNLPNSPGKSTHGFVITYMGKNNGCIYVCH